MEFNRRERLLIEKVDYTVEQLRKGKISLMTDLDGSRIRTSSLAVAVFNDRHNTNYTEADMVITWSMATWAEELGINPGRDYAVELWNSDEVMIHAQPVQGAVELSRFLYTHRNSKIEIPAITARPASTKAATHAWHQIWMPWSNTDSNLFLQTDGSVNTEYKTCVLKSQEPTYYLEDQTHDAEMIAAATENTKVVLVSQPWNDGYQVPEEYKDRILKAPARLGQSKVLMAFQSVVEDYCK